MTPAEFGALLLFATAMSFTPGPNTTLSTALAANGGLRHALRFVLAVPVGWSLLLVCTAAGLGAVVTAVPALRWSVKLLGLAYLLWLAWRLAWTGSARAGDAAAPRLDVGFAKGVALQFVNIKAWLAALTISAGWVAVGGEVVSRLALVVPVLAVYALVSNLAYALLGSLLRGWLGRGDRLLWFNRAMAALLVVTALWMAVA
jgi:threonine/homoserine/homoserine lactone efflux protein